MTASATLPATLASAQPLGTVRPERISPRRSVPASIVRPEYVDQPGPRPFTGSEVKDAETIARIRVACRLAAQALAAVGEAVVPGVTTDELDRVGHEFLLDHGAYPSTLGYRSFPKSLCTSVNEVVCHGIPDATVLREGDLVNIDITGYLVVDGVGVHGDTNATFGAGELDEESTLLLERARIAMERGIAAVRPGREVNVIGRVIETYARRFGYGTVREFTGHGIGTSFHSGLVIPHYDAAPEHDDVILPGMTFTVEPMITLGTAAWDMWDDGWTVVTRDRRRTAQFEHTILVTDAGAEVLTLPDPATVPVREHTIRETRPPAAGSRLGIGIDIGGSGIKGAVVDLTTGEFTTERLREPTPQPSTPDAVAKVVAQIVTALEKQLGDVPAAEVMIGATFPAVIQHGVARTAANVDSSWVGTDVADLLATATGHQVHVVNDADAAGVAEARFGAARDIRGVVLVATLGTGIGTALLVDGTLVPNTELGHLEIGGHDAEKRASDAARERHDLSWKHWAERLTEYFGACEALLWPELIVVGGGVSRKHDKFLDLIEVRTPLVPAQLLNAAGIVGAAVLASEQLTA